MTDTAKTTDDKEPWSVTVVAPNGTTGTLTMNADDEPQNLIDQFTQFIQIMHENDPEPIVQEPGSDPGVQPMVQARANHG